MNMITLKDIQKSYGTHQVLKDVNLNIHQGEIYGLIGKNGAGKTTIFKIILGLSEFEHGKISIAGSKSNNDLLRARKRIGFFIGKNFFDYLDARDNLDYYCMMKGIKDKKEIDRVLEFVGLQNAKGQFGGFSMGMKQRLGIAGAMLGNPEIIILDEPVNGLDPQGIGSSGYLERFTVDYDLPNEYNYSENCASIGLALFGLRMAQITGESQYMDVAERALYNTVLAGIVLDGKSFFYVNPLEVWPPACMEGTSKKHVKPIRQKWFGVACCPPNIARTLASLGQYVYAQKPEKKELYVNLFVSNETELDWNEDKISVKLQTEFPWVNTYSLEEIDNSQNLPAIFVDTDAPLREEKSDLFGGIVTVKAKAKKIVESSVSDSLYSGQKPQLEDIELTAIPYPYWNNRGEGEMLVWMKELRP
ncbi:glycoside hydrolase family 127 protein [Blautia sp. MSJ-9]|nr:glycoside hydrolase family 127 protein [Blautia sp. MSJ-9]